MVEQDERHCAYSINTLIHDTVVQLCKIIASTCTCTCMSTLLVNTVYTIADQSTNY